MTRAHARFRANGRIILRRSASTVLLAVAGVLASCGGGPEEAAITGGGSGSGGSGTACATGPAPAVLTWDAATDPDVSGYTVHYGTTPGNYSTTVPVPDPAAAMHSVTGLNSGIYFFAITASSSNPMRNDSAFSNEVCKIIL